jgi:hypothetical protein
VVLWQFSINYPRLAKAVVVLGLLVMAANVLSLGGKKTNYIAAGHWLAEHIEPSAAVYYEDGRLSYYAQRGYAQPTLPRETAMATGYAEHYQYFVVIADEQEPWLQAWMATHHLRPLAHFTQRKGKTVTVVGP